MFSRKLPSREKKFPTLENFFSCLEKIFSSVGKKFSRQRKRFAKDADFFFRHLCLTGRHANAGSCVAFTTSSVKKPLVSAENFGFYPTFSRHGIAQILSVLALLIWLNEKVRCHPLQGGRLKVYPYTYITKAHVACHHVQVSGRRFAGSVC